MRFSTILHLDSYHRDNVVNKVIDARDARRKVERMSNKRKFVEYAEDKNETRNESLSKIFKPVPLMERQKPKGMTSTITDNADFNDNPEHDYVNDAKTLLEKLQKYEKTPKKPSGPEIDALSGMADWGQIIEDSTTGFHGDVLLSEVEVKGWVKTS